MLYSEISWSNPTFTNLQKVKNQIINPNASLFWGRTATQYNLMPILSGLAYFTSVNLKFKTFKLGRDDNARYLLEQITRNNAPTRFEGLQPQDYDDNTPYQNLVINLVHVPYQITTTFEQDIPQWVQEQNYTELNAFSLALKTSPRHRVRVYRRTETINNTPVHIVTIFSAAGFNSDDYLLLRKIAAIIPLLTPALLTTEDKPLSDVLQTRIPIFRMLETTENAAEFLDALTEYLKTIPAYNDLEMLETISTLQNLNQFHKRNVERSINSINSQVESAEETLRSLLMQQRTLQYELAGMSDLSLTSEDLKMLINKKVINHPKLDSESLTYICKAPCLAFDKNAAVNYYKNIGDKQQVFARLFKLAFVDEKIILNFEDVIKINFRDISFTGRHIPTHYMYNVYAMRNPHHKHFDCWGNYSNAIKKLIQQYDFVQLFLQIKAAVGSINLVDYTVLNRFREDIASFYNAEDIYPADYKPFIIWKDESTDTLHSIHETLEHFTEGDADNETN